MSLAWGVVSPRVIFSGYPGDSGTAKLRTGTLDLQDPQLEKPMLSSWGVGGRGPGLCIFSKSL